MVRPPRTGMEAFQIMPEGTFCQLINDVLVMSPAPLISHARVQSHIFSAIAAYLKGQELGQAFFAPVDVYLNKKNAYQPDILYVAKDREDIIKEQGVFGAPDLVIEILSSRTRKNDLGKKKEVYEATGVKEYWIVDPESKWCEGFVLENKKFKSLGESTGELTIKMFKLEINF